MIQTIMSLSLAENRQSYHLYFYFAPCEINARVFVIFSTVGVTLRQLRIYTARDI